MVKPANIPIEDVGKFVAPFEVLYKEVEVPVMELRLTDPATGKVEQVEVGKKKVMKGNGMRPTGKFAKKIVEFENKMEDLYKYKIKVEENGNLAGFLKNS